MITRLLLLAQAPAPRELPFKVYWLWLSLGAVIILCGAGLLWYQRRMRRDAESGYNGFTLDQLRQLRARGELTDEEYQRMRGAVIASMQAQDPLMRTDDEAPPLARDTDRSDQ